MSDGLVGTTSRLSRSGRDWVGTTETFTDVLGVPRYRRPIRLAPADCASPPPVPASSDRPLPRGFAFEEIGRLELGDSLPEGVTTVPRSSGAMTLQARPAGAWAGADTVVVRIGRRGRLELIELRYPRGHDLSAALHDLRARYGSGDAVRGSAEVSWRNRTTEVYVSASERRPRAILSDPRGG